MKYGIDVAPLFPDYTIYCCFCVNIMKYNGIDISLKVIMYNLDIVKVAKLIKQDSQGNKKFDAVGIVYIYNFT